MKAVVTSFIWGMVVSGMVFCYVTYNVMDHIVKKRIPEPIIYEFTEMNDCSIKHDDLGLVKLSVKDLEGML